MIKILEVGDNRELLKGSNTYYQKQAQEDIFFTVMNAIYHQRQVEYDISSE